MTNPLKPPDPEEVRKFMERVKSGSPMIFEQIKDTGKNIRKAAGGILSAPVTLPAAVLEVGSHTAGNILAVPSAVLHKTGKIASDMRAGTYRALTGVDAMGQSA